MDLAHQLNGFWRSFREKAGGILEIKKFALGLKLHSFQALFDFCII